ncbi:TniB family NTP-binding protein [Shewanella sp. 0m-11]
MNYNNYRKIPSTLALHHSLTKAWEAINHIHLSFRGEQKQYGVLIIGPSGAGKSFLAENYAKQGMVKQTAEKKTIPILHHEVQIATTAPSNLLRSLMLEMDSPVPRKAVDFSELMAQFKAQLKAYEVELIILDEVQHTLPKNDGIKAQNMLKLFASMLDKCGVPIVFMGTKAAQRLITFGQDNCDYCDDEQLSRRLTSRVSLSEPLPVTKEGLDVLNFFIAKINQPVLNPAEDKELISRLCMAYSERSFGVLGKLFSGFDYSGVTSREELIDAFKQSFDLNCINGINPFDSKKMSLERVYQFVKKRKEDLKEKRANNAN